jgi:DNA-binding NtrC family response regulator
MPKRILVIDDERLITVSLRKILEKEGYLVETARGADEALRKAGLDHFDLVISDIRMPEINGIDVIKLMRQALREAGRPLIPEILITGFADDQAMAQAGELEVADYIHKPFNVKDFLETVKRALDQRNA